MVLGGAAVLGIWQATDNNASLSAEEGTLQSQTTQTLSEGEEINSDTLEMELMGYAYAIDHFTSVDVDDVRGLIESEDVHYIFLGRATCQWCRKLAMPLYEAGQETTTEIYYLDTTNSSNDPELLAFRETYAITTVPALLKCGSSCLELLSIDLSLDSAELKKEAINLLT